MNPKDLVGAKKAPLALVPVAGAIFSAPAHANGAGKYGPFNWRNQPVQLMTYIEAVQRHLAAFVDGQDLAEDTGIHHVAHAIAGLNIIADAMGLGNLIDNRPAKGPAADMLRAQDKSVAPVVTVHDPDALQAMFEATARPDMYDVPGSPRFLCGHGVEDIPDLACGTAIHWTKGEGIERKTTEHDADLIAICEDSGNHVQGRHWLSCPEFS
jgi:hypothetical protein